MTSNEQAATAGTRDEEQLAAYIEIWQSAVTDLLALLDELDPADWTVSTDLPGWRVHDVVAHTAHLETVLATGVDEVADIGDAPHVTGPMGMYTEMGVVNRRNVAPADLITEIRESTATRYAQLIAAPPTDASAKPPFAFGGLPWSWGRMLRNRPLDVWMHNQDIRRALGRPGDADTPAAQHTVDYLLESMGFVLGKRLGAAPGTSVVVSVEGHDPVAFEVDDNRRGQPCSTIPAAPTLTLRTDRATFAVLAGGRALPPIDSVTIEGDLELGERFLAAMGTTP